MRFLQWVGTVGLLPLAFVTARGWQRDRGRLATWLALSIGLLAGVSALGRIDEVTGGDHQLVTDLSVTVFPISGLALLWVRHTLVPLSDGARRLAVAGVVGVIALCLAVRLPAEPQPTYPPLQTVAILALFGTWIACVAEPVVRFWRASNGRPAVQRARLRGLATVYAGIVGILAVAVAAGLSTAHPERVGLIDLALQVVSVALLPVLYVSLLAPAWLRRWWREPEEVAVRQALEDLFFAAPSSQVLGERALAWAIRLVGGEAGVVVDGRGTLVAEAGMDTGEAGRLLHHLALSNPAASRLERLPGAPARYAIVAPLPAGDGGAIVVVSGPFTPLFGSDERARLARYASSVAAAFERLQLTDLLAQQTQRLEVLLDAVGDLGEGIALIQGSRLAWVNDAVCEITGYSRDDLLSLPSFRALLVPEDAEEIVRRVDQADRGELLSTAAETWLVRRDGTRVPVELSAKVVDDGDQVIAVCRDISERVRTEELERRRSTQLAALAAVTRDLAGRALDVEDLLPGIAHAGRLVLSCRSATLITVDAAGRTTRTIPVGIRPEVVDERDHLCVPLVHGDQVFGTLELVGKQVAEGSGAVGFDDVDAAVAAGLGVFAAEAIQLATAFDREHELVERLQAVDRMKDAFLNAVSHELRTPLTVMLGMAQTVQLHRDRIAPGQLDDLVAGLVRNARKLDRLLNELLDLDRLNRGILEPHRRPTDVAALVERVLIETSVDATHPVTAKVDAVVVDIDGPKVERIVENLLFNADRHTASGTPIWVIARRVPLGLELVVADAGDGVPAELRHTIFEPFRQADGDSAASGVGIGLSLVARFAELHGGRAWVTDREGGGAAFHVLLPCDDAVEPVEPAREDVLTG